MKKLIVIAPLLFICSVYAQDVPFIGKTSTQFCGGSACTDIFEIDKHHNLKITSCGTTHCIELYNGIYKPLILTSYDSGFLFKNNKIYMTDKKGSILQASEENCYSSFSEGEKLCSSEIYLHD